MAPEIVIRPWNRRRDRSALERWPRSELPAHWTMVLEKEPGQRQSWAIDQAGELVGRLTLRAVRLQYAKLGIYLRPDKYGQGIGTAALIAFRDISPVLFLVADVAVDNERARRCYERAGFFWLHTVENYHLMGLHVASYRIAARRAVSGPTC